MQPQSLNLAQKANLYRKAALYCLGILSFLYSFASNHFSQLSFKPSFLNFPIFIGEIVLLISFILLIVVWSVEPPQWNAWRIGWGVYIIWILVNALYGYFTNGPLAFRNAALFYYPLCIFLGREFYYKGFFSQKTIITILVLCLLSGIIKLTGLTFYYSYYNFTYLVLYLALILKLQDRRLRLIFSLCLPLLFPYQHFFRGSRSPLISFFSGVFFLFGCLFFGVWKPPVKVKILGAGLLLIVLILGLAKFGTETKLKSLTKISGIMANFRELDAHIERYSKTYTPKPLKVSLYNEDNLENFVKNQLPPVVAT